MKENANSAWGHLRPKHQNVSKTDALGHDSASEKMLSQNMWTKTNLDISAALAPKVSKIIQKLTIWSVRAALGPKGSKIGIVGASAILTIVLLSKYNTI